MAIIVSYKARKGTVHDPTISVTMLYKTFDEIVLGHMSNNLETSGRKTNIIILESELPVLKRSITF